LEPGSSKSEVTVGIRTLLEDTKVGMVGCVLPFLFFERQGRLLLVLSLLRSVTEREIWDQKSHRSTDFCVKAHASLAIASTYLSIGMNGTRMDWLG
jgi:hypothetical protein